MNEDKGFQDRVTAYYEGIQGMDESEKTFEAFIESYLISEEGSYLTGVNIPIDGGRGERMP